ncbi:MAG: amidohydrolase family protein, partial [Alphaproteobacteria bacterium]|nr:amidohydrolase family protein [Alphaproteobacteria bacterium]
MAARDDWLDQVQEKPIDPDREIVDPHHHLWNRGGSRYLLDELWADTGAGHNVVETVFLECRSAYLEDGPEHLRPVGETQFVAEIAEDSAKHPDKACIAGIVSHADLRHGELDAVLDAHEEAGRGLLRGIRHAGANDPNPQDLRIPGRAPLGLYEDDAFRAGVTRLGERSLSFDTWHYHHQNGAFRDLADAVPGTAMVLDHFGTPLGVGAYAGRREEIFAAWKDDIAAIAECPNVYAKLGGLAMPDNGFGWHAQALPPSSDDFVAAQARYYHHAIACFGPERCLF